MKNISVIVGSIVLLLCFVNTIMGQVAPPNPLSAPDLPGFTPNIRTIQAGSLIIPMDQNLQVLDPSGLQSLLPYGFIIRTLWENITVSWAIQTGKPSNGADFAASTVRASFGTIKGTIGSNPQAPASPSWSGWGNPANNINFYGGPFIIQAQYVPKALSQWQQWVNNATTRFVTVATSVYDNVMIHMLTQSATVDIRHTINAHPFVAVSNLDGNAPTQTAMLGCVYQNSTRQCQREDGSGWGAIFGNQASTVPCPAFTDQDHAGLEFGRHYVTYDCGESVAALSQTSCLATFSEPHWEWSSQNGPKYISALKSFIYSGANFIAQCASTYSYENSNSTTGSGTFLTNYGLQQRYATNGINTGSESLNTITNYPDLPVSQYVGAVSSAITGQVPDFYNIFNANGLAQNNNGQADSPPNGWTVPAASSNSAYNNFLQYAFPIVTNIYPTSQSDSVLKGRNVYLAAGAKYNPNNPLGSNIFYLGGHTWAGVTTKGTDNGRRLFLNAIVVPALRPPVCGFSFCTAGTACQPRNNCETCLCSSTGSGYQYTAIANCCLTNSDCASQPCTQCNTQTNKCVLIAGCCAPPSLNCTGSCQTCGNIAANGQGTCTGLTGCCSKNSDCGTSACLQCTVSGNGGTCSRLPAPCCDTTNDCSGTCIVCNNSVCSRKQPVSQCCLTKSDCGSDPCQICDTNTNLCVKKPGCCDTAADCGFNANTNPCVTCDTTLNTCIRTDSCCDSNSQCGACMQCGTNHTCVPSSDTSCCTTDSDCGSCKRCASGANGAKTCLAISDCCLTSADCEVCQNCTASVCVPLGDSCCRFDGDCPGCQICEDYKCVDHISLGCCNTTDDCTIARQYLLQNANGSYVNISDCDYVCQPPTAPAIHGYCQAVCTSPKNYTGLIVGLAVGIPLGLLALLALAAILAIIIMMKRDALTAKFARKDNNLGKDAQSNPLHEAKIKVHNSALNT